MGCCIPRIPIPPIYVSRSVCQTAQGLSGPLGAGDVIGGYSFGKHLSESSSDSKGSPIFYRIAMRRGPMTFTPDDSLGGFLDCDQCGICFDVPGTLTDLVRHCSPGRPACRVAAGASCSATSSLHGHL